MQTRFLSSPPPNPKVVLFLVRKGCGTFCHPVAIICESKLIPLVLPAASGECASARWSQPIKTPLSYSHQQRQVGEWKLVPLGHLHRLTAAFLFLLHSPPPPSHVVLNNSETMRQTVWGGGGINKCNFMREILWLCFLCILNRHKSPCTDIPSCNFFSNEVG